MERPQAGPVSVPETFIFCRTGASGACTALALVLVRGTMNAEVLVTARLWVGATIWVEVPTKTKLLPGGPG